MYRGILESKNDNNILHKTGSFANKSNSGNKQINKNSYHRFFGIDCSQ